MTWPTREDAEARFAAEMKDIVDGLRQPLTEEPLKVTFGLDWSQVIAIGILLGALVGLLAWWIWQ